MVWLTRIDYYYYYEAQVNTYSSNPTAANAQLAVASPTEQSSP
jgi:hypothetical protein